VLVVVVGGLVLLSLSTIFAGTEKAPAIYAQVQVGDHTLDIWRASPTGVLTFHVDGTDASVATRFTPRRRTIAQLGNGHVLSVTGYRSGGAAWKRLHALYGVTRQEVHSALVSGSPSPAPPTATVG
jgi:hypothetical protein